MSRPQEWVCHKGAVATPPTQVWGVLQVRVGQASDSSGNGGDANTTLLAASWLPPLWRPPKPWWSQGAARTLQQHLEHQKQQQQEQKQATMAAVGALGDQGELSVRALDGLHNNAAANSRRPTLMPQLNGLQHERYVMWGGVRVCDQPCYSHSVLSWPPLPPASDACKMQGLHKSCVVALGALVT